MKITQVRNATLKIEYAGLSFLIDPMLSEKGSWEGFPDTPRSDMRNPLVDLPMPLEEILRTDIIIVTHTHIDHWDDAASRLIDKQQLIFTQNEMDATLLRSQHFTNVRVLEETTNIFGITIVKTQGQHGSDVAYEIPEVAAVLGAACGLIFKHQLEKTLYIAGDTVWVQSVSDSLNNHRPDVVILNAGFANINGLGAIIMGKEDFVRTHNLLPDAVLIASHMEAVNHCILSRDELRMYCSEQGLSKHVQIPQDGETLSF